MNDAEFLAEAKKGNLDIRPVMGEDLEKIANRFFKVDPATVNKPALHSHRPPHSGLVQPAIVFQGYWRLR